MNKAKLAILLAGMLLVSQAFGSYSCAVSTTNVWGNDYQLDITVTNDGPDSISGWAVQVDFNEPTDVTNSWNVTMTGGDTASPSFTNCCGWNGNLAPGQSTTFGFQGTHDGSFETPTCSGNGASSGSSSTSSSSSNSSSSDSTSDGTNIAPLATASTSYVSSWETLSAVNDNSSPTNSNDKSSGAYGNWNNPNSIQWVQYDWPQNYTLTSSQVYWFDDNGGVLVPTTAYMEYWNGSSWVTIGDVPLAEDAFNTIFIDNVTTNRLRVSMLNTSQSTGILEWRVSGTPAGTSPPSSSGSAYTPVTTEYVYRDITTDNALFEDSEHFRVYYGTDGRDAGGILGHNSLAQATKVLDFLEAAYDYWMVERGFRSPGLPVNGRPGGPFKINVYSTVDLNAAGVMGFDLNAGLPYLVVHTNSIDSPNVYVHEFGHSITMSEYNWVYKGNTGAWWETTAQWHADDFVVFAPQYRPVAQRYGQPTSTIINLDAVIGRSYLTLVHADNRYEAWPFLTYLNSNPDGYPGFGQSTMSTMYRTHEGNETPLHTVARMTSTPWQQVVASYWARMAYLDIGHPLAQQRLMNVINDSAFRQRAYRNLTSAGNSFYRVIESRQPMYGGSNIIPLTVTGDGNVSFDITNLGNGLPESNFTAMVAVRSTSGNVRYEELPSGNGSVFVNGNEEATLVIANTPDTLYTYNAFESEGNDPEIRGLDYQVQITGAQPRDL